MRSPATLDRLDDVVPLLLRDRRLEVWFAVDPGSRFSGRLRERLTAAGALIMAWEQADQHRFHLIIAASENSDLARLRGPLVLLPHGAGYHRRSPVHHEWPSGLRRTALIQNERVLPHTIVVAGDDQVDVMRSVDPRLADRALVAGDPCLARLRASVPQRDLHRRAYQADGRRLVLLCSTWGPASLYGRRPDLAEQLTSRLPADDHRVVLTLHPNVWERHGPRQVDAWLRPAVTAGLVVVPAAGDWRPAMLAADLVISDHGSLTFYAAALGRPTLIAADGADEVVPHSPMADLLATLPRLTDDLPETAHHPEVHRPSTTDAIIDLFYDLLALPKLQDPPVPPTVPIPAIEVPSPLHFHATVDSVHRDDTTARITIERTTARWSTSSSVLTASEHCPDLALLERAGAIYTDHRTPAAAEHAKRLLTTFPGARVAIVPFDATRIAVACKQHTHAAETTAPISATAAALHWWTTLPPAERPSTIHVNAATASGTIVIA